MRPRYRLTRTFEEYYCQPEIPLCITDRWNGYGTMSLLGSFKRVYQSMLYNIFQGWKQGKNLGYLDYQNKAPKDMNGCWYLV